MDDAARRFRRGAWRRWYGLRWRIWQRWQAGRTRRRTVRGLTVTVLPGVLDPGWFFSSEVLVDALLRETRRPDRVLDLGTGSGVGALAALRAGAAAVVATDVDPVALACARENVPRAPAVGTVDLREGDLFAPVTGERFDLVAFNPPWLRRGDVRHAHALRLPSDLPGRFATGLAAHLADGGRAILVLSTTADAAAWLDPLAAAGFAAVPLVVRDRGSEVLTAWRLARVRP